MSDTKKEPAPETEALLDPAQIRAEQLRAQYETNLFVCPGSLADQAIALDATATRWFDVHAHMPGAVAKLTKTYTDKDGKEQSFTLDYVGHADITRILTLEDPLWNWEPMGVDEQGQPVMQRDRGGAPIGLWIRLTLHGQTRIGYGSCDAIVNGKPKRDPEKELIGDALRNAAMRFGVALKLWSKAEWDGSPEGRTDGVSHHAPGTSFDEAFTKEQLYWRGRGWPASTHQEALDHDEQCRELRNRITALPADDVERTRAFHQKLNDRTWPPNPDHFKAIATYVDGLDHERETKAQQAQEGPSVAAEGVATVEPEQTTTPEVEAPLLPAQDPAEDHDAMTARFVRIDAFLEACTDEQIKAELKRLGRTVPRTADGRLQMCRVAYHQSGFDPPQTDDSWIESGEV